MEFKNGTTKKPVTCADLEMVSSDNKHVLLRYVGALWDDVYFEAAQMACEVAAPSETATDYEDLVSKTVVHIGFNIQLNVIRPYADLRVRTKTGKTVLRRFPLIGTDDELANILDHFFSEGCQGVLPEFAAHFSRFYASWRQSQK